MTYEESVIKELEELRADLHETFSDENLAKRNAGDLGPAQRISAEAICEASHILIAGSGPNPTFGTGFGSHRLITTSTE